MAERGVIASLCMRVAIVPIVLAAGCAARVAISDEPATFNDPDAPIVCPAGSQRRVAATRYRDLLADPSGALAEPPPGYRPPVMLQPPKVRYPGAILNPHSGFASVFARIDRTGAASGLQVVCSSEPAFESAALEAMSTARFAPATIDGKPVEEDFAIVPFQFNLP
jgi:TonB family protein